MTTGPTHTSDLTSADVAGTLRDLAASPPGPPPVVSVYLDTRWSDERQRDRVRVFLKNEIRRATAMAAGALDAELAWVAAEGERLIGQAVPSEAAGVALFAGGPTPRREIVRLAVPLADSFTVADVPQLRPLAQALGEAPRAVLLFVDGESARLAALTPHGVADEVLLTTADIVGHHRRGGWALLVQSRYQRHIQDHRRRHFDAVAHTLADFLAHHEVESIVLAGEARNLAVFRSQLPSRVADRIIGEVAGARYEPTSALAERAVAAIHERGAAETALTLDEILAEADGGGRAVAGVDAIIDAANRDAVDRLYLLATYRADGRVCLTCQAIQRDRDVVCRWCGARTTVRELGEALVRRALASGGTVATIEAHGGLERAGGLAAMLRYPPRR
jgi:peptide subunit release factor 1 (eRF1)